MIVFRESKPIVEDVACVFVVLCSSAWVVIVMVGGLVPLEIPTKSVGVVLVAVGSVFGSGSW